jgi:hypothetical protein
MLCRQSIATLAVATSLALVTTAQAFDDKTYPDIDGIWRAIQIRTPGSQASFDPTKPWGRGQQAPLTDEYRAVHEASLADQANGGQGNWPSGVRCLPPGMPASMTVYGEMDIIVLPEVTHILLNHNTGYHRRVFTDGRDWPAEIEPTFQGYSIGRWVDENGDGRFNRLDVETRFLKGPRALDPTGLPVHADNRSIIKERFYYDKSDAALLHDEITLIDHAFTHPWTVLKSYRRDRSQFPVAHEQDCTGDTANLQIGKELYYLSAEKQLMPTRKDQAPPDLRYFHQPAK